MLFKSGVRKVPKKDANRVGPWYRSVEIEGKPQSAHTLEVVDQGGEQSGWVGDRVPLNKAFLINKRV